MRVLSLLTIGLASCAFADTIVFNLGGPTSIQLPSGAASKATGGSTLASIDHRDSAAVPVSSSLFNGNFTFTTGQRGAAEPGTSTGFEILDFDPSSEWSITGSGTIGATSFTNVVLASGYFIPDTTVHHAGSRNTLESNVYISYLAPGFLQAFGLQSFQPASGAVILSRPGSFSTSTFAYTNSGTGLALGQLSFTASVPESATEATLAVVGIALSALVRRSKRAASE